MAMLAEIEIIYIQLLDTIMEDTVIILRLNQQIMGTGLVSTSQILTYDDTNWHHLAVTVDNTAKNLHHIDGSLYASKNSVAILI